jgi:uracil-DNA glycosylase family 4
MKNILLYRGDEELVFIKEILKKRFSHLKEPVIHDLSESLSPSSCDLCPDITERKRPFGTGANGVMVILNAPRLVNKIEIAIHRTESVNLLKKMIQAVGLEMQQCYITNLIKCETASALIKPSDMVKNCIAILRKEIEIIKPEIIIVMGDILPLQSVVNSSTGITWFNTDHPVSLIKNNDLKRPAWETLKILKKKYQELNNARL